MIKIEFSKKEKSKTKKKETKTTKTSVQKKPMEFSKRLLIYDYFIALVLLIAFFLCLSINGIYTMVMTNNYIQMGMDVSMIAVTAPFDLVVIGTILGIWTGQLGISATAYYFMAKEDHRVQIPLKLIDEMPTELKTNVDMTQIIVSALNISTN